MSNFNYEKYTEITEKIIYLSNKLKDQSERDSKTFKVQDNLCRIIQEANRLNTYIRHYKDK